MKTTRHLPVLLALVAVLFSCDKPQPEALSLLEQAEQMIEVDLDSALVLIDSIYYPEKSFSTEDYMRYVVRRVQIRYKNYLPVSEDTLVFDAKKYFTTKSRDSEMSSLACYYSGCVRREQGGLHQAMLDYKEALSYASNTSDDALKGLIQYNLGELFSEHGFYKEALDNYLLAEQIYRQSPGDYRDREVHCKSEIGQMYLLLDEPDSSFAYFHKGLEIAESLNRRKLQSLITQNLSVSYAHIKEYDKAREFLHRSISLSEDSTLKPVYYLNLGQLYTRTGQSDSLSFYVDKLIETVDSTTDFPFKASTYNFLTNYYQSINNYEAAFEFLKKRNEIAEEMNQEKFQQSIFEASQKYDFIQQQRQYDHQLLQRQRYIILLLVFLLLSAFFVYYLLKRDAQQKITMQSLRNTIQVLYRTAKDLENKMSAETGQEEQLREVLLWKFNILHKSSLLKSELDNLEKMGTKKAIAKYDAIVYGKDSGSQWDSLVESIDELNPGLSQFIAESYPQFNETEFKVCLLSYAGLPPKEIAILINLSVNSVNMARTRIRQKLNLQEPRADFCEYIREQYTESRAEVHEYRPM